MAFLDTLLVDGNDIRAISGLSIIGQITGLRVVPGARKGDAEDIPNEQGLEGQDLPLAAYTIVVPVRLRGATRGERNDLARSLASLICGWSTGGLVTLTRRIATGSADLYLEHTAPGMFIGGLDIAIGNDVSGQAQLQYMQLKGAWSNDGGTTWTEP